MASRSNQSAEDPVPLPGAPRWKGRQSLELVCRFNQRCFQLIGETVARESGCTVPAVTENRALWATLDDAARLRAARFPFVVLDARFNDAEWWRSAIEGRAPDAPKFHCPGLSEQLMEETLLFAAQTVNWDTWVARLMLGMSPTVAMWLKDLPPQHVANIWRRHSAALQLRWQERPQLWRALLLAARDDDQMALVDCRTEAQLLFCADLFPVRK